MLQTWLIGLSLLSLPFWWGEPDNLRIVDATPLEDVIGTSRVQNPILAPDGSALAWLSVDEICVYRFEPDATTCSPMPEESRIGGGPYNPPIWSPDSRRIILHEDFILRMSDSDIWSLDVESGTLTNLTDDGYAGGLVNPDSATNINVDIAPVFHPLTGELYFLRLNAEESEFLLGETMVTLMKLNAGGVAEAVRMMSAELPGPTAIYRSGSFSEDGNTLYLTVMPPDIRNPASGIYALDLTTDDFVRLASLTDLQATLPEWAREFYFPGEIQLADGGLVVWLQDARRTTEFVIRTPVFIDLASGAATSLVDYSPFDSAESIAAVREEGDVSVFDQPVTGLVMPGGQQFWMLVIRPSDAMSVYALALPPNADTEPELLTTLTQAFRPLLESSPTRSEDGKLLMLDVLFSVEEETD